MMTSVKIVINKPEKAPKADAYADIKEQGRIPYGKTQDVKIPDSLYGNESDSPWRRKIWKRATSRGMGAAQRGGGYWSC